jgi:hypothetical protein
MDPNEVFHCERLRCNGVRKIICIKRQAAWIEEMKKPRHEECQNCPQGLAIKAEWKARQSVLLTEITQLGEEVGSHAEQS